MPKRQKPYLLHASFRPDAKIDYDSYPFSIPAVRELGDINFHPNVTFFVGENGAGKSTVLEALAVALGFGTEGGTKNVQFKTADSVSLLHDTPRLARGVPKPRDGYFLRAESFYNVATYMDETGYLDAYGAAHYTRSHTVSPLWRFYLTSFKAMAFTCLTSRRPPFLQAANSQRSASSTSWLIPILSSSLPHIHRSCSHIRTRRSFGSTVQGC